MKNLKKTNPRLIKLIRELRKLRNKEKAEIWGEVAENLIKPTRQMKKVNVWKINKITKENETIIVPGKVLGYGDLNHRVNVAAYQFSEGAKSKISNNMLIEELMLKNPKGDKVRVVS